MTKDNPKAHFVRVPDHLIEKCEAYGRQVVARYSGSGLHHMPWSLDEMTPDQLREWLASREEAGRNIDIETCEIGCWYADANGDEYGILDALGERGELEDGYIDKFNFVRSPDSGGWVCEGDLPTEKGIALDERRKRQREEYVRAHPEKA